MKVLGIGNGGREHELFRRLSDEGCDVRSLKGNPGIWRFAKMLDGAELADLEALATLAVADNFGLTVVGPEDPLDRGIVNIFNQHDLRIVGPTREAAKVTETSKVLCWAMLKKHGILVPAGTWVTNYEEFRRELARWSFPVVAKYDGLDAGKGVRVIHDSAQQREALEKMRGFPANSNFLIQECITGHEVSFFVATDGVDARFIGSAQDYKLFSGIMTGGMGGVAPHPLLTDARYQQIMDKIVMPYIAALRKEGRMYRGIMYFQLMLGDDGEIYVIEINCRFGDPEAQLVLPLLVSPLLPLLEATTVDGELKRVEVRLSEKKAVGYVLASHGYGTSKVDSDQEIDALHHYEIDGARISHAGTKYNEAGRLVTGGGRVATVVGIEDTYRLAQKKARHAAVCVNFKGKQWMEEIGDDAVAAEGVAA